MLSKRQILLGKTFALLLVFSAQAHAIFSINENKASIKNPIKHPDKKNVSKPYRYKYGNAQAESFNNALNGSSRDLSEEEQKELAIAMPQPNYDRWCARVSFNIGKIELRNITNKTQNGTNIAGAKVAQKSTNKNHTGLEFSVGYVFPNWRIEAEYLINTKLGYSKDPLFQNSSGSINSTIKGSTLLASLYYEFLEPGEFFHPFLAGSLGISSHKVASTFSGFLPGTGITNSTVANNAYGVAFGGSLGFRMQVYSQLHLQGAVRYTRLGRISIKDEGGFRTLKLKGNRNLIAGTFGFMVLI